MSDTPPPTKPKPGSLRDRIAAFEKPNAAAGKSPPAPPPLRPKPSGAVSWKPKPASPPAETGTFNTGGDGEGPSKSGSGGMSASDAKESIGRGGSLKERMAALQGRGAFGAPAPVATPPMGTGKKWVPPPKPVEEEVVAPAVPERGIEEKGTEDSPKAEGEVEKEKEAASPEGEADPEEEERQRRAAIAARMARLGGARVGMSPPVFGAKPVMKQRPSEDAASVKSVGSEGTPASPPTSPPIPAATLGISSVTEPEPEKHDTDAGAAPSPATDASPTDAPATSASPTDAPAIAIATPDDPSPASDAKDAAPAPAPAADTAKHATAMAMPVPAAPRRAAPPRKKRAVSPMPPVRAEVEAEEPAPVDAAKEEVSAEETPAPVDAVKVEEEEPAPADAAKETSTTVVEPAPAAAAADPPAQDEDERAAEGTPDVFLTPAEERATFITSPPPQPALAVPEPVEEAAVEPGVVEVAHAAAPVTAPVVAQEPEQEEPIAAPVVVEEPEKEMEEEEDVVKTPFGAPPAQVSMPTSEPTPPASASVGEGNITSAAPGGGFAQEEDGEEEEEREREAEREREREAEREEEHEAEAEAAEVHEAQAAADEEAEEAARRQRVAERMARMGGVNPLGARPPAPPVRKATVPVEVEAEEERGAPHEHEHEHEQGQEQEQHETEQAQAQEPEHEHEQEAPEEQAAAEENEEDEEAARKRRVMERMAKMGGFNPFAGAAPAMVRRESGKSEGGGEAGRDVPARKDSAPTPPARKDSAPPPPARKDSVPTPPARKDSASAPGQVQREAEDDDAEIPEPEEEEVAVGYQDAEEREEEQDAPHPTAHAVPSLRENEKEAESAYAEEQEEVAPPSPPPRVESRRSIPPPPPAAEDEEEEEDELPPPPPPRATEYRRSIPPPPADAVEEEKEELPPPPPPRASEHRRSIPPPPRAVPVPPPAPPALRESEEEEESAYEMEEEEAPPPPPPSRMRPLPTFRPIPPPPPPPDVAEEEKEEDAYPEEEVVEVPPPLPRGRHSVLGASSPAFNSSPARAAPAPPPPVTALEDDYEQLETPEIGAFEHVSAPSPPSHRDRRSVPPLPPTSHPEPDNAAAVAADWNAQDTMATGRRPSDIKTEGPYRGRTPSTSLLSPASAAFELKRAQEILDEEEGDPIDPEFHSPSRRTSAVDLQAVAAAQAEAAQEPEQAEPVEDPETVRRRTIAERMAKLGGIKFGAAPVPRARAQQASEDEQGGAAAAEPDTEQPSQDEEEEERARKERIASKLAGMGGMRIGMMPFGAGGLPPQQSKALGGPTPPPPPPARAVPPSRAPPPPQPSQEVDSEHESVTTNSEDGVRVEAEESEIEEIRHEDAQEEVAPPVPTRSAHRTSVSSIPAQGPSEPTRRTSQPPVPAGRPPVPSTMPQSRRASGQIAASPTSRKSSADTPPAAGSNHPRRASTLTKTQEFVMVDSEESPPPPARPASRPPPPRTGPPPAPPAAAPPPSDSVDSMSSSQWELPSIPTSSLDFGGGIDTSFSGFEGMPPKRDHPQSSQQPPAIRSTETHYSADDLVAIWGRVGVHLCEAATQLYEKSKKSLVGDGTYNGFVHAALDEVPNAARSPPPAWGYLVYSQAAGSVQKRLSDIMPGDIVALFDAKLKGHKGLATYSQTVGAGEPLVGIVSEFEPKKSKIRVFQANQHVGHQTVEAASYRLEDLKSGIVKVYRVLEA